MKDFNEVYQKYLEETKKGKEARHKLNPAVEPEVWLTVQFLFDNNAGTWEDFQERLKEMAKNEPKFYEALVKGSQKIEAAIRSANPDQYDAVEGTETMRFVFSEEKACALGYTTAACYEAVDKLFARYGIHPIAQGVYEAPDCQNSLTAFGVAHKLPYTDWFLQVIETWEAWDEDGEPEDCLALHYKYKARNA